MVAESLGNTAAVCRNSYINPLVFTAWERGLLMDVVPDDGRGMRMERATLAVLQTLSH